MCLLHSSGAAPQHTHRRDLREPRCAIRRLDPRKERILAQRVEADVRRRVRGGTRKRKLWIERMRASPEHQHDAEPLWRDGRWCRGTRAHFKAHTAVCAPIFRSC